MTAELGRRGFIGLPFAAMCQVSIVSWQTRRAFAIPVQVKTIHGPAWQFNATKLLDIVIKKGIQKVLRRKRTLHPDLVCIPVVLCGAGKDESTH